MLDIDAFKSHQWKTSSISMLSYKLLDKFLAYL